MQKFVFLDIDDVILPHDFPNLQNLKDRSGFDDYKKFPHEFMNYVSMDLLNLVNDSFGEHIYWLTTWELHMDGANIMFCDNLGLPHYKQIPWILESYASIGPMAGSDFWWKSHILNKFLNELEDQDYKAIWIDNEIGQQTVNEKIHKELLTNEKLLKVSPKIILTRRQITEAKEWLDA